MPLMLLVTVDTNDADYITAVRPITAEDVKKFEPLFKAIKAFKPYKTKSQTGSGLDWTHGHNWPYGECLREDLGEKPVTELYKDKVAPELVEEFSDEYVPRGEYGVHTIEEIRVLEVSNETRFL